MNPFRFLSGLLVISTIFLAIGALILRSENLVPVSLTFSTFVAIIIILAVSHFTWRENFLAALLGVILALVSIIINSTQPEHIYAILHPFGSISFTTLVISDIMGFYVLPVVYLVFYALRYQKLKTFSALTKIQSTG